MSSARVLVMVSSLMCVIHLYKYKDSFLPIRPLCEELKGIEFIINAQRWAGCVRLNVFVVRAIIQERISVESLSGQQTRGLQLIFHYLAAGFFPRALNTKIKRVGN